jgi:hypothetical protein
MCPFCKLNHINILKVINLCSARGWVGLWGNFKKRSDQYTEIIIIGNHHC